MTAKNGASGHLWARWLGQNMKQALHPSVAADGWQIEARLLDSHKDLYVFYKEQKTAIDKYQR